MKFGIYSTRYDESPEKLLEHYPVLENYDYEIVTKPVTYGASEYNKEFTINETYVRVDIYSIDQLITLMKNLGQPIIIDEHPAINVAECYIEIYDGFRE